MIALCVAVAAGYFIQRSIEKRHVWELDQVAAAYAGDAAAFENLRTAAKDRSVALMEDFLQRHHRIEPGDIDRAILSLTNANERLRRVALAELALLPEHADDWLKARHGAITNEIWKERLKPAIQHRAQVQKQTAGFLTGLYSEHFNQLFAARRAVLQKNCHDGPAQLFFAYAPFDQTWSMLKDSAPDVRLRFLLLRLYAERDDSAVEHLARFPGSDVLRVAAETWWPVEIEPLAADGAYSWTTRAAATKGNVAAHLLRLSLRPVSPQGGPQEWLHLDRWHRWSYLFRYSEPILGKDAVVFAEDGVRKANQGWHTNAKSYQKKEEGKFWLPGPAEMSFIGPGRAETVRGIPPTSRVPVVALTKPEELRWHGGMVFEWARPLVPAAIQTQLRFSPNEFPVPKIFSTSEEAAQDSSPKRTRKRR